ncbi:CLAVATA3/ESR (CLE)-related protein 46-like isoform X2 [Punica granatum]|uniref:CLAVATA3/ESR (CLE)-related protein 46-like isoform X2 n=1 Tax=Punica granatum TaxID=22663 RepID=A0A6P8E4H7_PUNGR|nr:CLAVATA3/ESR (CLE)-related protein 46-like isoform X2 [Punica granatum]
MSPKECHQTRNGMGRKEAAIVRVLLPVWLLLAASEHHFPAFAYARAIHSADSKLGPDRQNLYIPKENIRSTMGGEKKIRRTPSGPNPAGNQHPPTKKH